MPRLALFLVLLLGGCGAAPAAPTATLVPTATTAPVPTVAPTPNLQATVAAAVAATLAAQPTATRVPPTATTAPTPTITPSVAPTAGATLPAATRSTSGDEQAYLAKLRDLARVVQQHREAFGELVNSPKPADPEWKARLDSPRLAYQGAYREVQALTPPARLQPMHTTYVAALAHYSDALDDLMAAAERPTANDVQARLASARTKVNEGNRLLGEAAALLAAATAAATTTPVPAAPTSTPVPQAPAPKPAAATATPIPAAPAPKPAAPAPKPAASGKAAPISQNACPPTHPIKGNQGSRNQSDWIYWVPDSRNYDQTDPEECFATVQDAVAAGYRAPAR